MRVLVLVIWKLMRRNLWLCLVDRCGVVLLLLLLGIVIKPVI